MITDDQRVSGIEQRVRGSGAGLVNGGVYVLRKDVLADYPTRFSIELDLLPRLIKGSELTGRQYNGFFLDIGVPETFAAAQTEIPVHRRRPVFVSRPRWRPEP